MLGRPLAQPWLGERGLRLLAGYHFTGPSSSSLDSMKTSSALTFATSLA